MPRKFLRRDSGRFSKLGKKRKKLQKWRGAKGRDNKIRENRKGYPKSPRLGFKSEKAKAGKINEMDTRVVYTVKEVESISKKNGWAIIIGKVGAKKKLDIIKKANELQIPIVNVAGKFTTGGKLEAQ